MTQETLLPNAVPAAPQAPHTDRRRLGRTNVSPHLVPLLRAAGTHPSLLDDCDWSTLDNDDAMAPARGLTIGLLLAIPLWALIGGAGYLVFW